MKKEMLKAMKMPAKKAPEMEMEEDLSLEDMELPEEDMAEEEVGMEEDMMAEEPAAALEEVSDDDLLAEIKKRGLSMPEAEEVDEAEMEAEAEG